MKLLRPLLAIALLSAGCGSENAATPSSGGGQAAEPTVVVQDRAVQFADCMRENGSAEFPDPGDSDQAFAEGIERASKAAGFDAALSACEDLRPPGLLGAKRNASQQDAALAFAECIREHGVTDFPDPVEGEPLVDTNKIPSTNGSGGMATLNAAMQTCGEFAEKALGSRP